MPEIAFEFLIRIGCYPQCPYMNNLGIEEGLWVGFYITYQGTNEILGFSTACCDKYPVTAMDMAEDLLLGAELLRISLSHRIQELIVPRAHVHVVSPVLLGYYNVKRLSSAVLINAPCRQRYVYIFVSLA